MSWVVDTCLLIDVLDDDPKFGATSAALLDRMAPAGLVLCLVSYVELAPAFLGDSRRQDEFLRAGGVRSDDPWTSADTRRAHRAWAEHIVRRRARRVARRPGADVLIGAFAAERKGLLTRNAGDFRSIFAGLAIHSP